MRRNIRSSLAPIDKQSKSQMKLRGKLLKWNVDGGNDIKRVGIYRGTPTECRNL
jgi:hypothetical protein